MQIIFVKRNGFRIKNHSNPNHIILAHSVNTNYDFSFDTFKVTHLHYPKSIANSRKLVYAVVGIQL